VYDQVTSNKRRSWLLVAAFVLFVALVAVAFTYVVGYGGPFGIVVAFVIAVGASFAAYWSSDAVALRVSRAKAASEEEYARYHNVVEGLCIASGLPKPRLYVVDDPAPNAFATGRNPRHAAVAVTTGLLEKMNRIELEGVLAHELSHVAHRDVAVMTIASFLGVLAGVMTRIAVFGGFGRASDSRDSNTAIAMLVIPLVSAVVYVISFLLTRLLSRYRELSADRSAALLTGRPSALASALTKVTGQMARIPTQDLRKAEPFNTFWFAPAFSSKQSLSRLFSSHPTLEQRLEQLGRISAQLGRAA
jgi:heat shock protein HtpX